MAGTRTSSSTVERLLGQACARNLPAEIHQEKLNGKVVIGRLRLLQLTDAAPLSLKIFDLAGRLVATRTETVAGSGRFQLGWDGRNESGGLVAPGLYVYRIAVEAGTGRDDHTGTIGVAY